MLVALEAARSCAEWVMLAARWMTARSHASRKGMKPATWAYFFRKASSRTICAP